MKMKISFLLLMLISSGTLLAQGNPPCPSDLASQVRRGAETYYDRTNIPDSNSPTGFCDDTNQGAPIGTPAPNAPRTGATAQDSNEDPCARRERMLNQVAGGNTIPDQQMAAINTQCQEYRQQQGSNQRDHNAILSGNRTDSCRTLQGLMGENFSTPVNEQATAMANEPEVQKRIAECKQLSAIAKSQGNPPFQDTDPRGSRRQSLDGAIQCNLPASFTIDYNACVSASKLYDGVRVAEKAMDMQQQVRTESNARKAQAEAAKKAAEGDMQTGVLDAGISNHDHMKGMMKEKIGAYMIAVGLLSKSLFSFPGEKKAREVCKGSQSEIPQQTCEQTVSGSKNSIVANGDTKMALVTAIAEFTAKGIAAQRAMKMHDDASDAIAKAKQPYDEEPQDLMLERCQFNPADPACLTPGERVSGGGIARGEFGMGEGGNNAFNLNPESGEFGEVGVETSLDDGNEVASLNNPFSDDAKRANGILNPAAAAQVQAAGGAGGGSGGGVGGGMGGGGASLGSDLAGADKDGDKEAQIKAGKVSGIYGAAGGGGYRGIARSKENANPFASLFDKKGAGGGTEIDGSIPADIDGKASGLFQKISKRYTRIHADKRIEARNLE